MKNRIYFFTFILLAAVTGIVSCKKDNYSAPSSVLSGHITYKGEAISVEYRQVTFEIYQYGFGKISPVGVVSDGGLTNAVTTFDQDGSYSQVLFDGNYKFTIPAGQGPFMWKQTGGKSDSVSITMNGNQTMDFEVTPYYMIRTPQITITAGKASSTCKIEKIITDANARNIESVSLYVNKTQFVSPADNIAKYDSAIASTTDLNNLKLSVTVPAIVPAQTYVYVRLGLKIAGLDDRIFTPVTKINL